MTLTETAQLRADIIERQLLESQFIPATELALIIELARISRRALGAQTKLRPFERSVLREVRNYAPA